MQMTGMNNSSSKNQRNESTHPSIPPQDSFNVNNPTELSANQNINYSVGGRQRAMTGRQPNFIPKTLFITPSESSNSEENEDRNNEFNNLENPNEVNEFSKNSNNEYESLVCNFYKETSEVLSKKYQARRMTFDYINKPNFAFEPNRKYNKFVPNQTVGYTQRNTMEKVSTSFSPNLNTNTSFTPIVNPNTAFNNSNCIPSNLSFEGFRQNRFNEMQNMNMNPNLVQNININNNFQMTSIYNPGFYENNQNMFVQEKKPHFVNNNYQEQEEPFPPDFNPEEYIYVRFNKRGWECIKCNNFNFESKYINLIF